MEPRSTTCPRCDAQVTVADAGGTICLNCGNEYIPYPKHTKAQRKQQDIQAVAAAAALVTMLAFLFFVMIVVGVFQ